jgi:manganese/zinc/iron transport system permease protein
MPDRMGIVGTEFVQLSLTPILIGVLARHCLCAAGQFPAAEAPGADRDAISHVVLPGIVAAFLVTRTIAAGPMMIGAAPRPSSPSGDRTGQRMGPYRAGGRHGRRLYGMFAAGVLVPLR